jgi:hypothetical protein
MVCRDKLCRDVGFAAAVGQQTNHQVDVLRTLRPYFWGCCPRTRVVEQTGILKCLAPRVSVSLIMCTDGAGAPTGSGIVPAARWRFDSACAGSPVPTGILLLGTRQPLGSLA